MEAVCGLLYMQDTFSAVQATTQEKIKIVPEGYASSELPFPFLINLPSNLQKWPEKGNQKRLYISSPSNPAVLDTGPRLPTGKHISTAVEQIMYQILGSQAYLHYCIGSVLDCSSGCVWQTVRKQYVDSSPPDLNPKNLHYHAIWACIACCCGVVAECPYSGEWVTFNRKYCVPSTAVGIIYAACEHIRPLPLQHKAEWLGAVKMWLSRCCKRCCNSPFRWCCQKVYCLQH